jgi:hypothetical protein
MPVVGRRCGKLASAREGATGSAGRTESPSTRGRYVFAGQHRIVFRRAGTRARARRGDAPCPSFPPTPIWISSAARPASCTPAAIRAVLAANADPAVLKRYDDDLDAAFEEATQRSPKTVVRASSMPHCCSGLTRPTSSPSRPESIAPTCSTRTRVVSPSSSISGRNDAGLALWDVGATSITERGSSS